jgi:hypothetical protein
VTSVTGVRVVSLAVPIVISEGGENKAIACSVRLFISPDVYSVTILIQVFRVDQPIYL